MRRSLGGDLGRGRFGGGLGGSCTTDSATAGTSFNGAHEQSRPPETRPRIRPIPKPPRLDTGIEISARIVTATPQNTRTIGWNHALIPSTIISRPMIREPAPAVVDIATVRPPSVRCA